MGNVKGGLKEFEKLMTDLDKDNNGVIDYSEFLTAAVNKY
jgi:calcium-dependent protein kinase